MENDKGQLKEILLNVTLSHLIEGVGQSGRIINGGSYLSGTNYLPGLTLPSVFHNHPEKYTLLITFLKHEETNFSRLLADHPIRSTGGRDERTASMCAMTLINAH